jgi:nucleoside-diphosphate-sugar epimerase
MRIFLTGATGFIGSHVARLLVRHGHEVHALVREDSDPTRIADVVSQLRRVDGDLTAWDPLGARLQQIRPEVCLHLGWYVEPGKYLGSRTNLDMVAATLRLATLLADVGCRRFVGLGTCFEYDTARGYLAEDSPLGPVHLYSACKAGLALMLEQLGAATGMGIAWARLFYLYGPFEDERRLVASVIRALLRGEEARTTAGAQVRDFLHVEDVASALWALAQSAGVGPVNIGSGQPVTVRELVTRIGQIVGRPELVRLGGLPYTPQDPMFVCANNDRLTSATMWQPRYTLDEGLRQTVEWWRSRLRQSDPLRGLPEDRR